MSEPCVFPLICPVCAQPLALAGNALRCEQGHTFDLSREGYANLLRGGGKKSATMGDTREMAQARRRFLDAGHYAPLSQAINETARAALEPALFPAPPVVVEAGCGEGYYIAQLRDALAETLPHGELCTVGLDISKEAVRLAAKRHRSTRFVVADIWQQLPLADQSVQVLLNVFAPRNPSEFARVIDPNGRLLIVIPAPSHLAALREEFGLLDIEADKQQRVTEQLADAFVLVSEQALSFPIPLAGAALQDLVQMTPNFWHQSPDAAAALATRPVTPIQVAFQLLLFHPTP